MAVIRSVHKKVDCSTDAKCYVESFHSLYKVADVRAYCSHVKMYCKRARLLSSHPLLFIRSGPSAIQCKTLLPVVYLLNFSL